MLSVTSEYALRALTCLAQSDGQKVLGHELAHRAGVPNNYLSKIMIVLRNAGLVKAVRGITGGYALVRQPGDVKILDVVELFEMDAVRGTCLLDRNTGCSEETRCAAHASWRGVRDSWLRFLQNTTLADVSPPPVPR
ncbi:MAG: Rrf2 family transcriptional regulator [Acidobacteria bacterium]|nr:Rrf2 family transcriptional regulator [Acidobacteriota bacterium]